MSVITFMIGNGFDLACGLRSQFINSYDGYVNSESSSEAIRNFKETIEDDIESWADFEMRLAKYAHNFKTETELAECISDYSAYLDSYLKEEEKPFLQLINSDSNYKDAIDEVMAESLKGFYESLIPNDVNAIDLALYGKAARYYNFISFNYTKVFDVLAKNAFNSKYLFGSLGTQYSINSFIHIHGEIGNNIVLGVDNECQLDGLPFVLSKKGKRRIIKPTFIDEYDAERKRKAKECIDSSNTICVFGLSLGESDLTWKQALADWLLANSDHHLVFYNHDLSMKQYPSVDVNQKMDDEEDAKEKLVSSLCGANLDEETQSKLLKQVHIPTGTNIFDISNIKYETEKGAEVANPPVVS